MIEGRWRRRDSRGGSGNPVPLRLTPFPPFWNLPSPRPRGWRRGDGGGLRARAVRRDVHQTRGGWVHAHAVPAGPHSHWREWLRASGATRPRTAMQKLRSIKSGVGLGWESAHVAVSPRPLISLDTGLARTEGYPYAASVWAVSIVQGPFPVAPCRSFALRFAALSWLCAGDAGGGGDVRGRAHGPRALRGAAAAERRSRGGGGSGAGGPEVRFVRQRGGRSRRATARGGGGPRRHADGGAWFPRFELSRVPRNPY